MRTAVIFVAIAAVLAYIASPYFTLWRLKQAIERNDEFALERLVDWPRIREQMRGEMMSVISSIMNERQSEGGDFGKSLTAMLGPAMVGQVVDAKFNPSAFLRSAQDPASGFNLARQRLVYAFFVGPTAFRADFVSAIPFSNETFPFSIFLEFYGLGWKVTHLKYPTEQILAAAKQQSADKLQTDPSSAKEDALPPAEACKVDNWKFRGTSIGVTFIEGTTTCASGKIYIRAFDGKGQYLGNATGYIEAHSFDTSVSAPAPSERRVNEACA